MGSVILLILGILASGGYSLGLKPVNTRCKSIAELQLFNGCFTIVAGIGAFLAAAIRGSVYIPLSGLLVSALFGIIFSLCVFSNLKALESGPVSITTLIINFSLVMPLIYSFFFENGAVTPVRIAGVLMLCVCMFLFTNPKVTGEKKLSLKWLGLTLFSMFSNGALSLIMKIYAVKTENAYGGPFLAFSYLFATLTSFILFGILNRSLAENERCKIKAFFSGMMPLFIFLIGLANFSLNFIVVLLTTRLPAMIVYPAIQGGSPLITAIASYFLFKESVSWKKAAAILLGVAAIVLLNL